MYNSIVVLIELVNISVFFFRKKVLSFFVMLVRFSPLKPMGMGFIPPNKRITEI